MAIYGSTDDADSYHSARGNAAWTALDADTKSAALQRGSDYVDAAYGDRFPGEPAGGLNQDLAWPRADAEDRWGNSIADDAVPTRVEYAAYEAALIEAVTPGALSRTFTPSEQKVLVQVQNIRWQPVGGGDGKHGSVPISTKIEGLLDPLLTTSADIPAILVV